MSRSRDSQRSKLYGAEDVVHGRDLLTVEACQAYVDKLMTSKRFVDRYGHLPRVSVADGRGRIHAGSRTWRAEITLPRHCRYEEVVLHEISHQVADRVYGRNLAAHGWQFAQTLVELVQMNMGKAEADKMRRSFRSAKVRFTKPRAKRQLTAEQKAALVERLAVARAAKLSRLERTVDAA